jgi:hypothetical protein
VTKVVIKAARKQQDSRKGDRGTFKSNFEEPAEVLESFELSLVNAIVDLLFFHS